MNTNNNKKPGILITGATGDIGRHFILQLLLENKYTIFCVSRSQENNNQKDRLFNTILDLAKTLNIKQDLMLMNKSNLVVIEGCLRNLQLGMNDHDIDLLSKYDIKHIWHFATIINNSESIDNNIKYNIEVINEIINLTKILGIEELNFISYENIETDHICKNSNYRLFLYKSIKKEIEKFLEVNSKKNNLHIRIFKPSNILSIYNSYNFLYIFYNFINWIKLRMPDYFRHNHLNIYAGDQYIFNLLPIDIFIKEIIELSKTKKKSPEIHYFKNQHVLSSKFILNSLKQLQPDIMINIIDDQNYLSEIDRLFKQKFEYYLLNNNKDNDQYFENHYWNLYSFSQNEFDMQVNFFHKYYQETNLYSSRKELKIFDSFKKENLICRYQKNLTYYTIGHGPAIIIISAYGTEVSGWEGIVSFFYKNYSILLWECRGFYDTDQDIQFNIDEHVNDLEEILSNENIKYAHIVSWCSGAKIALSFAHKNPNFVNSLSFVAGCFFPIKNWENIKTAWDTNIVGMANNLDKNTHLASLYIDAMSDLFDYKVNENTPKEFVKLLSVVSSNYKNVVNKPYTDEYRIITYSKMILDYYAYDITYMLGEINIPTFILAAQNDIIADPKLLEIVASYIKKAKYTCLPTSTHWLIMENQDELINELNYFISNI